MSKWIRAHVVTSNSHVLLECHDWENPPAAGTNVLVRVRKPRSSQQHALYWVLLGRIAAGDDRWHNAENLHNWIKIKLGMYDAFPVGNRTVVQIHSTDFATMDQDDFNQYFVQSVALLSEELGIDAMEILE